MLIFDTPILVYHRIASDALAKDPWRLTVSVQRFERQMRYLYEHGYHCFALMELLQSLRDEQAHRRKRVVLTFDDGYESFYTLAYPILRRYAFTATVFLVTDRIGERNNHETEAADPFLNWKQVKSLHADGIAFGSHTCTHPHLSHLSSAQVRRELFSSKKYLEDILESRIQLLAYPHGDSNLEVQQIAKAAGYGAACGSRKGKSGRFNIWRTTCRTDDTLLGFVLKLTKWPYLANSFREETRIAQFIRKVRHAFNR